MNILIVDDSSMFRALAGRTLEQAGFTVRGLDPGSAFEVLKTCVDFKPQLTILDYHLPRCNPETLALILKEDPAFQPMKILGVSNTRDPEVMERLVKAGVDRFIYKGTMASLLENVRDILG